MRKPAPSRNPWPIAITAFFILFFSGLVSFIVFASTQHVDLVRADYYEQEIRYQQQFERVQRTEQIRERVGVGYNAGEGQITVQLPAGYASPSSGQIHLYRPSDARLDRTYPLAPDGTGQQRLNAHELQRGLWKVRVEWTIGGQEYYTDQPIVIGATRRS